MSEDCIFCSIVAGDVPSYTVYEDDDTVAFLDVNPIARGHVVVIPKAHHGRLQELPPDLARDLFGAIQRVVAGAIEALDADGTNVGVNDGEVAGQAVPHVHAHVVPRFEGDGGRSFHAVAAGPKEFSDDEMADIADRLAAAV